MKNLFIIVFLISFFDSFSQFNVGNYEFTIERDQSEFVIKAAYINSTNNTPPQSGDEFADLNFAIKFPDAYTNTTITLSVASTSFNIVKNGSLKQGSGFKYQDFSINSSLNITSNWVLNVPVEIVRISFSVTNPNANDEAELAAINEVSSSLPNINVEFFDYTPDVSGFAPLPITLKTFSARKWGDRSARLNWMTSSEVNSAYFGVERSKDALVWENIGHVQAAGESQTERSYEFIDDHLPVGRNASQVYYYRLLMVDLDGKYNYSDIRGLNFRNFFEGIIKVYPNPTTSHINLDLSGWDNTEDNTHLHVYDGTGKQMLKKDIIGNGIELIEVSQWPSGPYNILISKGDKSHHHRIVKVD